MHLRNCRDLYFGVAVIILFLTFTACQKKLADQNLSPVQKNILEAAKNLKETYNSHNKEAYAKLISDDAKLLTGTGSDKKYMSKSEYTSKFPQRWEIYPEFRNTFYDIKMVNKKNAIVKTYFLINRKRINLDWLFKEKNGRWLLSGFEY